MKVIDLDNVPKRFEIISDRTGITDVKSFDFGSNDVTKLLRQILKETFPNTQFSVVKKKSTYDYGHYVTWTDGATEREVDSIVRFFTEKTFDGMDDSTSYVVIKDTTTGNVYEFNGWSYPSTYRRLSTESEQMIAELLKTDSSLAAYVDGIDAASDQARRIWLASHRVSFDPIAPTLDEPVKTCEICQQEIDGKEYDADGHTVCENCYSKISEYAERLERRIDRLRTAADRALADYESDHKRAQTMAKSIPFGQPILIGHYSEKADRRFRDRIHNTFGRAFAHYQRSKDITERANAAEKNKAISSDDPAAPIKLRDKIAKAEADQERMKATNKLVRKAMKMDEEKRAMWLAEQLEYDVLTAEKLLQPDFVGRVGYPSYLLTNNNANIRRMKQRLAQLEKRAEIIATADSEELVKEVEMGGEIRMEKDIEANRLRLHFPGKPSSEHRRLLKSYGFRWSPTNMAWQRHLSNGAEYDAKLVVNKILES